MVLCVRNLLDILPLEVAGNLLSGMPVETTHREGPLLRICNEPNWRCQGKLLLSAAGYPPL